MKQQKPVLNNSGIAHFCLVIDKTSYFGIASDLKKYNLNPVV
jgi:hypothetical protein